MTLITPKHASWLDMAEIEIGVMSRQCLARRIPTIEEMTSQVQARGIAAPAPSTSSAMDGGLWE
jgi:hypothetical protein